MDWINSFSHTIICITNGIICALLLGFILICCVRYIYPIKIKEQEGENIRYKSIITFITIIGLIIAIFSNVVIENDNNIAQTIWNPLLPKERLDLKSNIKSSEIKTHYVFCLDNSGSTRNSIKKIPNWYNKSRFDSIWKILNRGLIDMESLKDTVQKRLFNKNKSVKRSQLLLFKTIELLTYLDESNSFQIISFDKAYKLVYPPDTPLSEFEVANKKNIRYAIEYLFDNDILPFNQEKTDFSKLFNKLLDKDLYPHITRDNYIPTKYNFVVLSDFIHDVGFTNNIRASNIAMKMEELARYNIRLSAYHFNEEIPNVLHKIEEILRKNGVPFSKYNYNEKNQWLYNNQLLTSKLNILYSNRFLDESINKMTKISIKPENHAYLSIHNFKATANNQYYYRLNRIGITNEDSTVNDSTIFTSLLPNQLNKISNVRETDEIEIKYKGSVYNQFPNTYLNIKDPKEKKEVFIEIVFTRILPTHISIILMASLFLLLVFETHYFVILIKYLYD